jgi:hypothetical protein
LREGGNPKVMPHLERSQAMAILPASGSIG